MTLQTLSMLFQAIAIHIPFDNESLDVRIHALIEKYKILKIYFISFGSEIGDIIASKYPEDKIKSFEGNQNSLLRLHFHLVEIVIGENR